MTDSDLLPTRKVLTNGAEVIFSIPLGGYGHAADEQPLPYIRLGSQNLTPRFGGDEANIESGYSSLPLPVGKLLSKWPASQSLFNLTRRRVNIYWRNIFHSFNQYKPEFMFARQLKYTSKEHGFVGFSPLLNFTRELVFDKSSVEVVDTIKFKAFVVFEYFEFAHYACFSQDIDGIEILSDIIPNINNVKSSSTGEFVLNSHRLENVKFNRGDVLTNKLVYRVGHEF